MHAKDINISFHNMHWLENLLKNKTRLELVFLYLVSFNAIGNFTNLHYFILGVRKTPH